MEELWPTIKVFLVPILIVISLLFFNENKTEKKNKVQGKRNKKSSDEFEENLNDYFGTGDKKKYEDEWKRGTNPYDSCAQDYSSLENQRLSLEKIHGQPFQKACSKSSGSSAAQGGKRIKLRPQWPGVLQRRPRTHASPIHFSRKVIA